MFRDSSEHEIADIANLLFSFIVNINNRFLFVDVAQS